MGLDIVAYRNLVKLDATGNSLQEGVPADEPVVFTLNRDFPGREFPLVRNAYYGFQDSTGFRAGSYGGYNQWRWRLAQLIGFAGGSKEAWQTKQDYPFKELIDFSDCEGTIGSRAAENLLQDFDAYAEMAKNQEDWFFELYQLWHCAIRMAADNGAIRFC